MYSLAPHLTSRARRGQDGDDSQSSDYVLQNECVHTLRPVSPAFIFRYEHKVWGALSFECETVEGGITTPCEGDDVREKEEEEAGMEYQPLKLSPKFASRIYCMPQLSKKVATLF